MRNDKLVNALGLICRSKKYIYGEKIFKNISNNSIKIIVTVSDISDTSYKKLFDKSNTYNIRLEKLDIRSEELEQMTKIKNIKAIGIIDENHKILFLKNLNA